MSSNKNNFNKNKVRILKSKVKSKKWSSEDFILQEIADPSFLLKERLDTLDRKIRYILENSSDFCGDCADCEEGVCDYHNPWND
jgi:hypothetical protein